MKSTYKRSLQAAARVPSLCFVLNIDPQLSKMTPLTSSLLLLLLLLLVERRRHVDCLKPSDPPSTKSVVHTSVPRDVM